jgi:hypothetical protein
MNERIRELAKQADLIKWDTLPSGARTPDHESVVKARKFAELLLAECTDLLFNESERLYGYASEFDNMSECQDAELVAEKCVDLMTMIEKHFGVE